MTALTKQRTVEVIAFLLIVLFTYTAVSKIMAGATFTVQLQKSPYLSDFAEEIAWLVPASETIISFLLAFPASRILGLYASFFLLCAFTTYIYAILHYSSFVPCACGGVIASLTWNQHLLLNTGFIALSIVGILLSPARQNKHLAL
ncbi:hypothetical protein OI18_22010 [Flavihumibacter solisilvae]|uniref:Methylamine utilisation protein MauE domain-containing protein n=2 Tax=Flavihumibacter solisilvae TaxID=1349421 RepID=A0A0C1KXM8_9BACT|nr:hypothetical protein OI18_22010 [Flavihumibacter solisilvae]